MAIHLTSITSTFFINLLNRLGCKPPPPEGFDLINTVQPVSIVDQDAILNVSSAEAVYVTPFGGTSVAPVAGTVIADTGPLAAGNWEFVIAIDILETVINQTMKLQHRDAANAANIWERQYYHGTSMTTISRDFRIGKTFALNERLRIINGVNAGAAMPYTGLIFARQTS